MRFHLGRPAEGIVEKDDLGIIKEMKLLDSVRSRLSGQSQEAFGLGQRYPLNKSMIKSIRYHMNNLVKTDLSAYTFERRHSDHPGAKSDLIIYDGDQKATLVGREMSGGDTSFWSN